MNIVAHIDLSASALIQRHHPDNRRAWRSVNSCCNEHLGCSCGWMCEGEGEHTGDGHESHAAHLVAVLRHAGLLATTGPTS